MNYVLGNLVNRCSLRNGESGFCVAPRDCQMMRELSMIFDDQFCDSDRTLFCCDITAEVSSGTTTTEAEETRISQISFTDHPNYSKFKLRSCGKIETGFRIANGDKAEIMEFPFTALIGYKKFETENVVFGCGGSLISGIFIII